MSEGEMIMQVVKIILIGFGLYVFIVFGLEVIGLLEIIAGV